MRSITLNEGRVVYAPLHAPRVVTFAPLNTDYPSCPLGLRVSDLPIGWATAGRQPASRPDGKPRTPKLTPDEVVSIRHAIQGGATATSLAPKYGVALTTITRIARGETWTGI